MRVLLVEDHRALRDMMAAHLRGGGFVTDAVARGDEALAAASTSAYDAVVLDLGLPDLDGIAVLRALRAGAAADVPVLVLTARDAIEDRVQGLDAGADDYLLKPFDLNEFDARLRSVLRRPGLRRTPVLELGILTFDTEAREASIRGVLLELSRRELSLLEELVRGVGRTVVRDTLEDRLYGLSDVVSGNALEAAVSRLRRHLARAAATASPSRPYAVSATGWSCARRQTPAPDVSKVNIRQLAQPPRRIDVAAAVRRPGAGVRPAFDRTGP